MTSVSENPIFRRAEASDDVLCRQLRGAAGRSRHRWTRDMMEQAARRIHDLTTALTEARQDAARLEWVVTHIEDPWPLSHSAWDDDPRAAIDAAMATALAPESPVPNHAPTPPARGQEEQ